MCLVYNCICILQRLKVSKMHAMGQSSYRCVLMHVMRWGITSGGVKGGHELAQVVSRRALTVVICRVAHIPKRLRR